MLLYWHNPHVHKTAGKYVYKGHQVIKEAGLAVAGPLKEPFEDADEDEVDHQDNGDGRKEVSLIQIQHDKTENTSKDLEPSSMNSYIIHE